MSEPKCACPAWSAYRCAEIRLDLDATDEPCNCACHAENDDGPYAVPDEFEDDDQQCDFTEEDVVT